MKYRTLTRTSWIAALAFALGATGVFAQSPAVRAILDRARAQEESGHIDLAAQSWQQVLLADPNNAQAVAGLARWAKLSGNDAQAAKYIDRLRQLNPNDPTIAKVQALVSMKEQNTQRQLAAHLAQSGHPEEALKLYRQIWPDRPPDGDWALAFYDTQASVPSERDNAVGGLRALVKKYPADVRYSVALGRILTYGQKTRAEGEHILRAHPEDATAQAALRQALVWDAQNPSSAPAIREYLKQHQDAELARDLADEEARQTAANHGLAQSPEENAAFNALSAGKVEVARARFEALHDLQPENPRVLAGLGFVSMKQGDFAAATSYLERADQTGLHDKAVESSLITSRFWNDVQAGTAALNADRFDESEAQYKAALAIHPDSPEALEGLSGAYIKAGQSSLAIPIYRHLMKLNGSSAAAWRGLLTAQVQAKQANDAVTTVRSMPPAVSDNLNRDPEYLRNLAAAYSATGQDAQALQIMAKALSLPAAGTNRNLKGSLLLQYAGLLAAAKRYEQAAATYRDILAADSSDVNAWQGLVAVQHEAGHDAEAVETVERMPPGTYDVAMQDASFLSLAAAIYEQQNHLDIAQGFLERATKVYADKSQPIPISLELQIAAIELQQGNAARSYAIYRAVLLTHPDRVDAWKGLMSGLHQTGHDEDALAQAAQIPPSIRHALEQDPEYLQTLASIEASAGNHRGALQLLAQARALYAASRTTMPAEAEIQSAWLLYNAGLDGNSPSVDRDLYHTLMSLGGRADLSDTQRRRVQVIWATWSVRRAAQATESGNTRRALQILMAAQQAFPGNPDVTKALAGGYLQAGEPKQAMAIYESPEMADALANPTVSDYQGMIGAAIAVPNMTQAEAWLQHAMTTYPKDPQILGMAARYEQARGDNARAAAYWKASLAAMPPDSAVNRLAHTLDRPDIVRPARTLTNTSLAGLLNPDSGSTVSVELPSASFSAPVVGVVPQSAGTPVAEMNPIPVPSADRNSASIPAPATSMRGGSNLQPSRAQKPARQPEPQSPLSSVPYSVAPPQDSNRITPYPRETSAFAPPALPQARADEDVAALEGPGSDAGGHAQLHLGITAANSASDRWSPVAVASAEPPAVEQSPVQLTLDYSPAVQYVPSMAPSYVAYDHATQMLASAARPVDAAFVQSQVGSVSDDRPYIPQYGPAPSLALPQWSAQQPTAPVLIAENQQAVTDSPQQDLPPLSGPWGNKRVFRQRDPREEAAMQLATIEGGFSPWVGGTGYITHRSGTVGLDQLTIFESPFEASTPLGGTARVTLVTTPSFLNSGALTGTGANRLGTLTAGASAGQQNASGVGGEVQVSARNFAASAGYTPYEFLVSNGIGRVQWRPSGGPLTFSFNRDAVRDSQLSYAGLKDPGSISSTYSGNAWGGVVANSGNFQYSQGDAKSGFYAGMGGQYLTGRHVETNHRIDGVAGAFWHVISIPDNGDLTLGANFFGMHYANNLRYFTYGQGGYFSPSSYLLMNLPVTWNGHSGVNLHYAVTGAFGVQAIQEEASPLFPLDAALQYANNNQYYPATSTIGGNYDVHGEVSYHVNDHWYIGGFFALNNTRDFGSETAGFFIRFLGRAQYPTELGPTGLFPYQGNRPLMVP